MRLNPIIRTVLGFKFDSLHVVLHNLCRYSEWFGASETEMFTHAVQTYWKAY